MSNSIFVIKPYWYNGTWVFDDETRGLVKEPFVSGFPFIITSMVKKAGIDLKAAKKGFRLLFSHEPFPEYHYQLDWARGEYGGNWYTVEELGREGWLCPALFKYFPEAPVVLFGKAELLANE